MFEYLWYNPKQYSSVPTFSGEKPLGWIEKQQIKCIMPIVWAEHCLECAVPLCYHHCENWIERVDGKCQKTYYGAKHLRYDDQDAAQLKFRKWGKIEAIVSASSMDLRKYRLLSRTLRLIERLAKNTSTLFKFIPYSYKICGAYHVFANRYLPSFGRKSNQLQHFLIQCFSSDENTYKLIVEFYSPQSVLFRESVEIHSGFNQTLFSVSKFTEQFDSRFRVRIYPENDIEAELTFIHADFIELKASQQISPLPAKKVKCVAWDLDNTVWNGVLIESQSEDLVLRHGVLELIKALDERGIIQIVVSKNDCEDVMPVLERLKISDFFVAVFANWNAKSENLRQAASMININLDTFALIDDSSYERGEVQENLSCVRCYDEKVIDNLLFLPCFDVPVTVDGKKRRKMYQLEFERNKLKESFSGTNEEFLKSCQLELEVYPLTDDTFARSFELVQRTNQLNLSGIKYSKEDFQSICVDTKYENLVLCCHDRFGEYGQVGFIHFLVNEGILTIYEYAMSCRVAAKHIEPALMQWLVKNYACEEIRFCGINSKKNGLLIRTLHGFGLDNM